MRDPHYSLEDQASSERLKSYLEKEGFYFDPINLTIHDSKTGSNECGIYVRAVTKKVGNKTEGWVCVLIPRQESRLLSALGDYKPPK